MSNNKKKIKKGQGANLMQRQWERDKEEWEQIKREWETYKAANEADREDFERFKAAVALTRAKFEKDRSSVLAKLAAQDWKQAVADPRKPSLSADASMLIHQAREELDERFFKAFGRALSEKKSLSVGLDKLTMAILELVWQNPGISDRAAVDELEKRFSIDEGMFNKHYNRIRASLPPEFQDRFPKRRPGRAAL